MLLQGKDALGVFFIIAISPIRHYSTKLSKQTTRLWSINWPSRAKPYPTMSTGSSKAT